MFSFMPKEKIFFDLFEQSAKNVHEGAIALLDLLTDYTDIQNKTKKIKNIEHAGDEITARIFDILAKTFITPLDREDIRDVASALDDIIDLIDTAVNRMSVYRIKESSEDAKALAQVLVKSTSLLIEAVSYLRNMKETQRIITLCQEIHMQENEGDRIHQHALEHLFDNGTDAVNIIKWKDIYFVLETATDRCEDAANVLHTIVVKNA
jgi:hypothetical protein